MLRRKLNNIIEWFNFEGMKAKYVTNKNGKATSVILSIRQYKKLREAYEELEDIRLYEKVKAKKEENEGITLDEYIQQRKKRKRALHLSA